jgi:hypothetical protein
VNLTILRRSERPYIMARDASDTRRPCRESGLVRWRKTTESATPSLLKSP